jgi:hypothetical protein
MMGKIEQGTKAFDDTKVFIKTNDWEPINFSQMFELLQLFFCNEDRCYPTGQGRTYLFKAIKDLHDGEHIQNLLIKYKFKSKGTGIIWEIIPLDLVPKEKEKIENKYFKLEEF